MGKLSRLPKALIGVIAASALLYAWAAAPIGAAAPAFPVNLDAVPSLDTKKRSVPLKNIFFDTFNGSSVRLSEAAKPLIRRLRDAIRPSTGPATGRPSPG